MTYYKALNSPAVNLSGVKIEYPTVLAPLAGWSDAPFRLLCREYGAGLVFTEMVSADGIVRHQKKSFDLYKFTPQEKPIVVQIFGSDADIIADAIKIVSQSSPDFIDINFGCPVKKVVKKGAGAALLRDLKLMQKIAQKAVEATSIPISAKLRSGWNNENINIHSACRILQDQGISLLTIHPRTQSQFFKGYANWQIIADVKKIVTIPVIGNGDIKTAEDARRMFQETGCDAIMIGRAACGNPWIFKAINDLNDNKKIKYPSMKEKIDLCIRHLDQSVEFYGEKRAIGIMRKQMSLYIKGVANASEVRRQLFSYREYKHIKESLLSLKYKAENNTDNSCESNVQPDMEDVCLQKM